MSTEDETAYVEISSLVLLTYLSKCYSSLSGLFLHKNQATFSILLSLPLEVLLYALTLAVVLPAPRGLGSTTV